MTTIAVWIYFLSLVPVWVLAVRWSVTYLGVDTSDPDQLLETFFAGWCAVLVAVLWPFALAMYLLARLTKAVT